MDHLARETHRALVRSIWPRRQLAGALKRQRTAELATQEQLEATARAINALSVSAEDACMATDRLTTFVEQALKHGRVASSSVVALGRIERAQSVDLLKRALDRDDLTLEAQAALAVLTGARASDIKSAAVDALCDFLDHRLGQGRVFAGALQALARVPTWRSVELLERALRDEALAQVARLALERLVGADAGDAQKAARAVLSLGYRRGTAPAAEVARSFDPADYSQTEPHQRPVVYSGAGESLLAAISKSVETSECLVLLGAGVHAPPPAHMRSLYPEPVRSLMRRELSKQLAEDSRFEAEYPGESPFNFSRVVEHYESGSG